jgi:hypothetical protein
LSWLSSHKYMRRHSFIDPVVEAYMHDVDRTLLRENLKLTPGQRLEKLVRFASFASTLRQAGRQTRAASQKKRKP